MAGEDRGDLGPRRSIREGAPAQAVAPRSAHSAIGRSNSEKSSARERIFVVAGWLAVLLVVGGSWQLAATHGLVDPVFTGMPTRIVVEFLRSLTGPPLTVDTFATVNGSTDRQRHRVYCRGRMRFCAGTERCMAADLRPLFHHTQWSSTGRTCPAIPALVRNWADVEDHAGCEHHLLCYVL
jgi:hypothetical protein